MYRRSPAESDHLLYYPQFRNICQAGILIFFSVIYFSEKVAQNSYRVFGEEDYQTYKEMHYIKSQLKDIAEHGSLDDERVLVYCQPVRNVHTGTYKSPIPQNPRCVCFCHRQDWYSRIVLFLWQKIRLHPPPQHDHSE